MIMVRKSSIVFATTFMALAAGLDGASAQLGSPDTRAAPNAFATPPVNSVRDPNLNLIQTYRGTGVRGLGSRGRGGVSNEEIDKNAPNYRTRGFRPNSGMRGMPDMGGRGLRSMRGGGMGRLR
jgi:hypothetical protein